MMRCEKDLLIVASGSLAGSIIRKPYMPEYRLRRRSSGNIMAVIPARASGLRDE